MSSKFASYLLHRVKGVLGCATNPQQVEASSGIWGKLTALKPGFHPTQRTQRIRVQRNGRKQDETRALLSLRIGRSVARLRQLRAYFPAFVALDINHGLLSCGRSSEADGCTDYVADGRSTVGLRVASAAAPLSLHERKVRGRHQSLVRVAHQTLPQRAAYRVPVVVLVVGRLALGSGGEQRPVGVRSPVAVPERHLDPVHLK